MEAGPHAQIAIYPSSPLVSDHIWHPDSRAIRQVTSNLVNLSLYFEYSNSKKLKIYDKIVLAIKYISITTLTFLSHTFQSTNVLHALFIFHNLVYVSKFA